VLDVATYPLRVVPAFDSRIEQMVLGKPIDVVADLLPRIFNLCRSAQESAARAAFGLPMKAGWQDALWAEILREHVVKLCLKWPGLMSRPALVLPRDWQSNPARLRNALFGAGHGMPADPARLDAWLASGVGIADGFRTLASRFGPGEAVRGRLPLVRPATLFAPGLKENSAAARHADHPVMQAIETHWGRGPLWSAMGVAYDVEALLSGELPGLVTTPGRAVVVAARGLYGVCAQVNAGKVVAFRRVTPTDHLLAPQGGLGQVLASLPQAKAKACAPLLLSVMDPCFPVSLQTAKEMTDA